jgi:hypothetical protein
MHCHGLLAAANTYELLSDSLALRKARRWLYMKNICTIFIFFMAFDVYAGNEDLNCLRSNYLDYTQKVHSYWVLKDSEFKKSNPDLHKDFSYLNTEQVNYNRMQEITINHLITTHPDELKFDGNLYNLVPRYKHYAQEIYRELRSEPEFNQLYLDIESYKKENKMPSYERLKTSSSALKKIDALPIVKAAMNEALKQSEIMISALPCGS